MECFRKPRLFQPPLARPTQTRLGLAMPALLMALVASPSFAQGEDESKKEVIIQIDDAEMAGSGCKKGASKVYAYHSQGPNTPIDSFVVEHDNFIVGGDARRRAFCAIAITATLPKHPDKTKSYQVSLAAVRQSGYMKLVDGIKAKVLTRIEMRNTSNPEVGGTNTQVGPFDSDFSYVISKFYDKDGKEREFWSECGRQAPINIRTDIKLVEATSEQRKKSTIIVDGVTNDEDPTTTGKYAQDFRLKWRVCDLPQKDDGGR